MAKLFQVELQVIADDRDTAEKIERKIEKALSTFNISGDILVQASGTIDDSEEDEENDSYGEGTDPY